VNSPSHLFFVLGTRPEAVKLAPLILGAQADPRFKTTVVSTGQHRDMLTPILDLFGVKVDHDFQLMQAGQDLATLNARISTQMAALLKEQKPDWTIVQGDTVTCMAAAISAFLLRCPVAHVEAGLRTHNLAAPWPEEFHRRATALTAGVHFAPTTTAENNLLAEGVPAANIHVTGNTGIDAQILALKLLHSRADLRAKVEKVLPKLNSSRDLVLVTVHRREAHGEPLRQILRAVLKIAEERPNVEIAIPVHKNPEVRRVVMEIMGAGSTRIHLTDPLDYLSFLALMEKSTLILTDSGGVQEEAPTLKKPVLVLRETTERDEAVQAGCAKLVGFDEIKIVSSALELLDNARLREAMFAKANPFGDGHSVQRILQIFARTPLRQAV